MSIKIKSVQHIAIATQESKELLQRFKDLFDLESTGSELVESQKVKTDFLPIGETTFELLEPTAEDSPISKFLQKRGNGFHHLALEVEDLDAATEFLKSKAVRLISEQPGKGAHGTRTLFIHPKAFNGILVELVELPS